MIFNRLQKSKSTKSGESNYRVEHHKDGEQQPVFTLLALRPTATGIAKYSFYHDDRLIAVSRYACPLPVESISLDIHSEKYYAKIDRFATIPTVVNVMDSIDQRTISVTLTGLNTKQCMVDGHIIRKNKGAFTMDHQLLCLVKRENTGYIKDNGLYVDTKYYLKFFSDRYIGLIAFLLMI